MCLNQLSAILEAGYILPVTSIRMEGKPELLRALLIHHTLLRSKAELDQLKSGLTAIGVSEAISQHPTILEPYFVAGKQPPLTAGSAFFSAHAIYAHHITIPLLITTTDRIRDMFKTIHFSDPGTTLRTKEEATYMNFLDLLNECEGKYYI